MKYIYILASIAIISITSAYAGTNTGCLSYQRQGNDPVTLQAGGRYFICCKDKKNMEITTEVPTTTGTTCGDAATKYCTKNNSQPSNACDINKIKGRISYSAN